jgi:hypothetical protein
MQAAAGAIVECGNTHPASWKQFDERRFTPERPSVEAMAPKEYCGYLLLLL